MSERTCWEALLDHAERLRVTEEFLDNVLGGSKSRRAVAVRQAIMRGLVDEGYATTEIAKTFKVSTQAVLYAIRSTPMGSGSLLERVAGLERRLTALEAQHAHG